jgi:hypothetical protein
MKDIQAICHDRLHVIAGELRDVSARGCELISRSAEGTAPTFPRKVNVLINLVDESTGKSMNVHARLTSVCRKEGCWAYRVRWQALPPILKRAA